MESTSFMRVDEVAQELGISKSYAYKIVQKLNAELKEKGFMTISGRVNKQYFIHDIRHSHVSLLIDMGFSATAIADRVGHESIDITYNYAHLFPSKQAEMADKLDMERGE